MPPHDPDRRPPADRTPTGTVTVAEVAAAAGVSRQTVSNVLNAPHRVRPETRDRVTAAIDALGYQPNRAAQVLRAQASRLLGYRIRPVRPIALASILDRFLHALAETARTIDHQLLVFAADDQDEIAACERLFGSGTVDGFVLNEIDYQDSRPGAVAALGAPVASFGRTDGDHLWVDVANATGTDRATEHLIAAGHRRIALLGWPAGNRIGDDRAAGWRQAMTRHGLPTAGLGLRVPNTSEDAAQLTATLLAAPEPPTAVVASSDIQAVGALQLAAGRGANLAITGFDDTPTAGVLGLTSVRQPVEEAAREIVRLLLPRLPGRHPASAAEPANTPPARTGRLLPPELIVRSSSTRPGPAG